MSSENTFYHFCLNYGWAILSAILVIGVLYLVIGIPNVINSDMNMTCVAEKTCQAEKLQLNHYSLGDKFMLYCKGQLGNNKNLEWRLDFKIGNLTEFVEKYPECAYEK